MPLLSKDLLKSFFESGDKPTASQFASLIDSMMHLYDDRHRIGLRVYESSRSYLPGDTTLFDNSLFVCTTETTGTFQSDHWQPVMSAGAVTYMGTWNAQSNTPALQNNAGVKGQYYVVTVAGTTSINGITDWQVGDWIIYNGSQWQKVDNSENVFLPTATQVVFTPTGVITESNVQAALAQLLNWTTSQLAGKTDAFTGATGNVVSFDLQQRPVDSGLSLAVVPRLQGGISEPGNFISSLGGNEIQDAGVNAGSFMPASATAENIPVNAPAGYTATNLQTMVNELDANLIAKLPGAAESTIPIISNIGGLKQTNVTLNDFLAKTNTLSYTPSDSFHPATKQYVDEGDANFLSKTNRIPFIPSDTYHPATKQYVDNYSRNFLSLTNTSSYTPGADFNPATKKYVDDADANFLSRTNTGIYVPTENYHPTTKKYVDESVRSVVMVSIPFTGVGVPVGGTAWSRLGLFVLGDLAEMYPGATFVGIKARYGYRLPSGTTCDLALSVDTAVNPLTFLSQSMVALSPSALVARSPISGESVISNNANTLISIVGRRPTGPGTIAIHSATLFLRFI
ncbi:MAG: hypothetical protein MUC87_05215 [Bacteroidia bacterium]|jgi:hypothetical protein|nr:hypothetical protein [Bacteroidia bacterium]